MSVAAYFDEKIWNISLPWHSFGSLLMALRDIKTKQLTVVVARALTSSPSHAFSTNNKQSLQNANADVNLTFG